MKQKHYRVCEFNRSLIDLAYYTKIKQGVTPIHDTIESARIDINKLEKAYPNDQYVIIEYPIDHNPRIIYFTH